MMQTPGRNIIDCNVMQKFGIRANAIPEGSFFINQPVSLLESYGWYIGAALLALLLESILIFILVLSLRNRKEALKALSLLSSRLLTSQEEEQRRIAMELHDQTGQDILFLRLQLQGLKTRLRNDQNTLKEECDKILTHTTRIIDDVRRMAYGLNPSELQTLGLCAALKALIQNFSEQTRIPVHYHMEALEKDGFRPETQIVLYRIFQEALTNIFKHARAKAVGIDVRRQGNCLSISIKDDGQGFDPNRYRMSEPNVDRGMGLSALKLRSRMIGADLTIESQPGHGTEIKLSVPIKENKIP
jgi:signal transduction histidine kinase